jgi:hypothetical protein
MGWARGLDVMRGIVIAVNGAKALVVSGFDGVDFYERVIEVLNEHDWDAHDEAFGIDDDLDEALRNKGYGVEEEEEDEESDAAVEQLIAEIADLKKQRDRAIDSCEREAKERRSLREELTAEQKRLAALKEETVDLRQALGFQANYPLTKDQCRDLVLDAKKRNQQLAAVALRLRLEVGGKSTDEIARAIDTKIVEMQKNEGRTAT